jgi:glutamyl-tRNA reductase
VQLARDLHGDLEALTGLVIGAGEMGDILVEGFRQAGLTRLVATARTPARSEALARHLDCHEVPFEDLAETLAGADIVLTAVGSRRYPVSAEMIEAALRVRRHRPMFLVDGGIPGDVDPAAGRLEDAFLFDLADLEKVAWQGMAEREQAATEARAIVEAGVEAFVHGQLARSAVPLLRALRDHFEEVRRQVLEGDPVRDAGEVTRRLVNRLLHSPSESLRDIAAERDLDQAEAVIRRLFGLAPEETEGSGADEGEEPRRRERR